MTVGRIFLNELSGNPNKRNSSDETCIHILCSAESPVTADEMEARLSCIELLMQWSRTSSETTGDEEKLDLSAIDDVS